MKNLTISNFGKTSGANWGGTIYTDGNLNLDNVALNSNAVRGGIVSGGAITSVGKTVTNIMGNSSFSKIMLMIMVVAERSITLLLPLLLRLTASQ